jgi:hypothetical protein
MTERAKPMKSMEATTARPVSKPFLTFLVSSMVLLWLPPYFSLVSLSPFCHFLYLLQKGLRDTNEKYGGNHSKTIEDTRNDRKGLETPMKSMEATTARP